MVNKTLFIIRCRVILTGAERTVDTGSVFDWFSDCGSGGS